MSADLAAIEEASKLIPSTQRADFLGVLCSAGCAVHCAATPVLISLLPSISTVRFLANPLFHQAVAVVCAAIVVKSILPGWRKHRSIPVVSLAALGLGMLFLAAFLLPDICCEEPSVVMASEVEMTTESPSQSLHQDHVHSRRQPTSSLGPQVETRAAGVLFTPRLGLSPDPSSVVGRVVWWLQHIQPYLSPLGGMILIVAHLLNIRLSCCTAGGCRGQSVQA